MGKIIICFEDKINDNCHEYYFEVEQDNIQIGALYCMLNTYIICTSIEIDIYHNPIYYLNVVDDMIRQNISKLKILPQILTPFTPRYRI